MPEFSQLQFEGMPEPSGPREPRKRPRSGQWSGPMPGQFALHHNEADHEGTTHTTWNNDKAWFDHETRYPEVDGHGLLPENHDQIDAGTRFEGSHARSLYRTHGGAFAKTSTELVDEHAKRMGISHSEARDEYSPSQINDYEHKHYAVTSHWEGQPLHQISAHTPVHTAQSIHETLDPQSDGQNRVDAIRQSLQSGDPMRTPAWLVKQNGRLYSLDGHHRILAARQAGMKSYPARAWDRDAQLAKQKKNRAAMNAQRAS